MPSQQATAFFIRVAPLSFAFLWSSGFIVAKYAAPDADPFTFALIYLVPPLTAIEAFVLFGESLSAVQIIGMAVTAAGVWLATRRA